MVDWKITSMECAFLRQKESPQADLEVNLFFVLLESKKIKK